MSNYEITQLDGLPPKRCPCGLTRRAFTDVPGAAASLHLVNVQADSRAHYHQRTTEIYLVLEGEGEIELDGQRHPIKPLTAIYIKPGCRHRAIGNAMVMSRRATQAPFRRSTSAAIFFATGRETVTSRPQPWPACQP